MRLTFEADTFGDIIRQVQLFIHQTEAVPGEMSRLGMDENTQTDSPDAFVPDFKDDFDPYSNEKLDDPLPEAMAEPKQTRKKKKLTSKKEKATPGEKAKSPKKSSRRKGNGGANPAKAAISVGADVGLEISDHDVGKAASAAAQTLTPKVIQKIKGEYGVDNVAQLDQGQRREFIDQLNAKLEEANG